MPVKPAGFCFCSCVLQSSSSRGGFLHGLEENARAASHAFLHACPGSETYPTASRPLKEPNGPLSYSSAGPVKSPFPLLRSLPVAPQIQVCQTPETTYQASDDSNSTLDKPLPSCLTSLTSHPSQLACPLSNALRILDPDPVTVKLTTRTTPLKPKQETTLTNRKFD
ncbi:hypothetical protein CRENBAI_002677 [Crenichthys baileyi]|uniref:Uncharacterized protein n=1 Tax=Crenichthys baileyi TaxID=28760 RepID=A0AAV9SH39_9TELE